MEERTTVEKRTTVTRPGTGTTNVHVDGDTGATQVTTDEPVERETVVRETIVERP
ncbi:MAG TPA: hypothetical protein VFM93_01985 [Candidatus Limnocylindria bacterium]|nr:hypothetical protein [Candidatus Limnocylindria bacterium]